MRLPRLLTENRLDPGEPLPVEAAWLRVLGIGTLVTFVVLACVTKPVAGLHGRGPAILALTVVFIVAALRAIPLTGLSAERRTAMLVLAAVAALGGLALQPQGAWVAMPYIVAAVGVMRLPARLALGLFVADLVATLLIASAAGNTDAAGSIGVGVVPFFLFMRLMRRQREAHDETKQLVRALETSRAAEAEAAAEAERARLAREMHDVLAHSLSASALQLESARLLAAERGAAPEVVAAIEAAHAQTAAGLVEARRAIGALRGDELPSLPSLVESFGGGCGFAVAGEAHRLAPEAQLALYRTTQEALTNVRRHAPEGQRVDVSVAYEPEGTRLRVRDRGTKGTVPFVPDGSGYGLTGMRERAELLGGRLDAAPTDDGFCVELWLPA